MSERSITWIDSMEKAVSSCLGVLVTYFYNPINNWLTIKSIGKRRKSNMNE